MESALEYPYVPKKYLPAMLLGLVLLVLALQVLRFWVIGRFAFVSMTVGLPLGAVLLLIVGVGASLRVVLLDDGMRREVLLFGAADERTARFIAWGEVRKVVALPSALGTWGSPVVRVLPDGAMGSLKSIDFPPLAMESADQTLAWLDEIVHSCDSEKVDISVVLFAEIVAAALGETIPGGWECDSCPDLLDGHFYRFMRRMRSRERPRHSLAGLHACVAELTGSSEEATCLARLALDHDPADRLARLALVASAREAPLASPEVRYPEVLAAWRRSCGQARLSSARGPADR